MTTATFNRLYFASFLVLLFIGWGAVLIFAAREPRLPLPPELKELKVRYAQIKPEMTEQEIDAIFAGYDCSKSDLTIYGDPQGHPISQCTFVKTYDKQVSREGDYGVLVYFDYFGRVIDKHIGEYQH